MIASHYKKNVLEDEHGAELSFRQPLPIPPCSSAGDWYFAFVLTIWLLPALYFGQGNASQLIFSGLCIYSRLMTLIKEIYYMCLSLNYLNSCYLKAELYVHFFLLDVSGVGFCTK
jgi:hypothetical protein